MSDALEERDGKVSINGGTNTNLWFADDIDALAEEEQELEAWVCICLVCDFSIVAACSFTPVW